MDMASRQRVIDWLLKWFRLNTNIVSLGRCHASRNEISILYKLRYKCSVFYTALECKFVDFYCVQAYLHISAVQLN